MNFWAGVTDNSWFSFLQRAKPDEVNFWRPSGRSRFAALESGAPFLFKLKRPNNHIAGGGYFVKYSVLPLSVAWETFETKNGAPTRAEFEALIRPLTPDPLARDPDIGCIVLAEPFFWPTDLWIANPPGWAPGIMQGRVYDSSEPDGNNLWKEVELRLDASRMADVALGIAAEPEARYGKPMLVNPRLGQGAFRVLVTDAYKRRCAVTGESTLPVLDAAHIVPFAQQGPHQISNGLLLRSDFHKLFDLGYVTVNSDLRVEISPRIKEEWFNGKAYYRLHGQPLSVLPDSVECRPKREFLDWHNTKVFQP